MGEGRAVRLGAASVEGEKRFEGAKIRFIEIDVSESKKSLRCHVKYCQMYLILLE